MINECSKLVLRYYDTRHDLVGKVIHRKLYEELKFDHANKLYMHNPESVHENEMHKLFWDFEIQMNHQISIRRPEIIIINNKKRELAELWTLVSQQTTE